jgi:hypothetical protein
MASFIMYDLRLPLLYSRGLRSSWILRGVGWKLVTASGSAFTLEDGTDM